MFCDQNDDIEKCNLNDVKRVFVGYSSSSKAYPVYKKCVHWKKMFMWFLMSLEKLRSKLQNKKDSEMEEMLQIQRNDLNSELAEEYPLHESSNPKEANADDELDEGPGLIDNAEQRWYNSNW